MAKRILLIDDDDLIRESFEMIFSDLGFEVSTSDNGQDGATLAVTEDFVLVLTDIRMPGFNGAATVRSILERKPETAVYILTAYPGDPLVQAALEAGARGLMRKPFEIAKILDLVGN